VGGKKYLRDTVYLNEVHIVGPGNDGLSESRKVSNNRSSFLWTADVDRGIDLGRSATESQSARQHTRRLIALTENV